MGLSFLIICLTLAIAVVTILSATGLCDKIPLGPGGVYFVLSYVLGGRLGFVVGTLYTFGQVSTCVYQVHDDTFFDYTICVGLDFYTACLIMYF